jgi:signal transduction histidine kinase
VQVAVNLLSNAVKFSPAGTGRVAVSLRGGAGGIRLVVQDNGPGIAAEHLPLLFDKFSQFGDQRSGKPAGSGLGLAICRRIVEHLGGDIFAESPPGEGARFSVVLPYAGEVTRTPP